jgi:PadR family transcriptional regulator, regulatory protein PadR
MDNTPQSPSNWDVQLRKGSLELVILAALSPRPLYGLELLNKLHQYETMQISEGTLYPLLDRLKRDAVISAQWQQEGDARPRKYYALSDEGRQRLTDLSLRWRQSVADIESLLPPKE